VTDRRYPVGHFEAPSSIDDETLQDWIHEIAELPAQLRATLAELDPAALDRPYRLGGWTRRQVIHHLADSHTNSLVRFKWALTEQRPLIKAYDERAWSELADVQRVPIATALDFIEALHARWVVLLRSLTRAELRREFVHPESGPVELTVNVGIYAWHGRHHLGHLRLAE
jgi:hypothetical protein